MAKMTVAAISAFLRFAGGEASRFGVVGWSDLAMRICRHWCSVAMIDVLHANEN